MMEKIAKYLDLLIRKITGLTSSERDKKVLILGVICLLIFVFVFSFQSFSSSTEKYRKQIKVLEKDLKELKSLKNEYKISEARLKELTKSIKKEDEALISVVERILIDNQIDRKSFSIKDHNIRTSELDDLYDEKSVQVDVRKVSLRRMIDVLYEIQNRETFLKVSDLRIRTKFDKKDHLDVSFKLSTFGLKQVI